MKFRKSASILILAFLFICCSNSDTKSKFITEGDVSLANDRVTLIKANLTWRIVDQELFKKHTKYLELAKDREYDYYWVSMYEAIVIEYAYKEVPKVLDDIIIKKVMRDCNKYLAVENLGLEVVNLKLEPKGTVIKKSN